MKDFRQDEEHAVKIKISMARKILMRYSIVSRDFAAVSKMSGYEKIHFDVGIDDRFGCCNCPAESEARLLSTYR